VTPSEVITEVRRLIQDTRAPLRYSDETLLGFVNQTLNRMVVLRPDLFSVLGELSVTSGSAVQQLPEGAIRLVEIFYVKDGSALSEVDWFMMNRSSPNWPAATPGTPVNYMRHVRNPTRYFLYPPPVAGTTLVAEYTNTPPEYELDEEIAVLPDAYMPALIDGTVFLAESIDNEHVNSGRAKMFQDSFTQLLGVSLQARVVTDTHSAGLEPEQVI
jgi:hypothetical protein